MHKSFVLFDFDQIPTIYTPNTTNEIITVLRLAIQLTNEINERMNERTNVRLHNNNNNNNLLRKLSHG